MGDPPEPPLGRPRAITHADPEEKGRHTTPAPEDDQVAGGWKMDSMTRPASGLPWPVLAWVALGGALGASARHGLDLLWPHAASGVSWTTLAINVTGSLLIGVLMELIVHRWPHNPYTRPFLGVGLLGGYTTFSAYSVDVVTALERGFPLTAFAYLALTLIGALTAAWAASSLAHRALAHGGGRNP